MPVTLIRHTKPEVAENICYGRSDLTLAATFEAEAQAVVSALPAAECLISSPLFRCRSLADRIGEALGVRPVVDSRVQEIDFGAWEGKPWADISRRQLDQWAGDFLHARPHGGESVAMLRQRVLAAIDEYRQSGKDHIVVTHAGVIKAALSGGDHAGQWNAAIDFGEMVELP